MAYVAIMCRMNVDEHGFVDLSRTGTKMIRSSPTADDIIVVRTCELDALCSRVVRSLIIRILSPDVRWVHSISVISIPPRGGPCSLLCALLSRIVSPRLLLLPLLLRSHRTVHVEIGALGTVAQNIIGVANELETRGGGGITVLVGMPDTHSGSKKKERESTAETGVMRTYVSSDLILTPSSCRSLALSLVCSAAASLRGRSSSMACVVVSLRVCAMPLTILLLAACMRA